MQRCRTDIQQVTLEAKQFPGKVRELEHFKNDDDSNDGKYGVEEINEKNREIIRHADPNAPRTPDQGSRLKTRAATPQRPIPRIRRQ